MKDFKNNWWDLGKQYIEEAVQAQKNLVKDQKAVEKEEAAQAVVYAIRLGYQTFNPFVQLLIDDSLDYKIEEMDFTTKNLVYFDKIYPLRAAWGGMQGSISLLGEIKEELNSFLQMKNLVAGNLLLNGKPPIRIFFKKGEDIEGKDFFELMGVSKPEDTISEMEKLIPEDSLDYNYLIKAIQSSLEKGHFLAEDAKVKTYKENKEKIQKFLSILKPTICDLLEDSSLGEFEAPQLCQVLNRMSKPNRMPEQKKQQLELLSRDLTLQCNELSTIDRSIHDYCKSKVTVFFENLKKNPALFDADCALLYAKIFNQSLRIWQSSKTNESLESSWQYLTSDSNNQEQDLWMLSSGLFAQLSRATLEACSPSDAEINTLNGKLQNLIKKAQNDSWDIFEEGYLQAYAGPFLKDHAQKYQQIYFKQFADTWRLEDLDKGEFTVVTGGSNISKILALADERIELLDRTTPLIEADYKKSWQPLIDQGAKHQNDLQEIHERQIDNIISSEITKIKMPAKVVKKLYEEWQQQPKLPDANSNFEFFLKLKLTAWTGIVDPNYQDPDSGSSLVLLAVQYGNNLELFNFLATKRRVGLGVKNKRSLVVANYSLKSGQLASSSLQNGVVDRMHSALNLLYEMENDIRKYFDNLHSRGLQRQAKLQSNKTFNIIYSACRKFLEAIGFGRYAKARESEVERLLEIIQGALNDGLPSSFRDLVQRELGQSYKGFFSELRSIVESYLKQIERNPNLANLVNGSPDMEQKFKAEKVLLEKRMEAICQENEELKRMLREQGQQFQDQLEEQRRQFQDQLEEQKRQSQEKFERQQKQIDFVLQFFKGEVTEKGIKQQLVAQEPKSTVADPSGSGIEQSENKTNIQKSSGSPVFWSNPDIHWYENGEVEQLLSSYFNEKLSEVKIFTPMLGTACDGVVENQALQTLAASFQEFVECKLPSQNKVIMPLNLNNRHWALIYLCFETEKETTLYYFDPFGNEMPANVVDVFKNTVVSKTTVVNLPIRLQNDGYNCGPWIVEGARSLIQEGGLPGEGFDINQARAKQQQLLRQQQVQQSSLNDKNLSLGV
jgi:hypothetical protein